MSGKCGMSNVDVGEHGASAPAGASRTINANATVTGLIKSAVRVKNVENEVLEAAGVLDLRNTINEGLIEASDFVAEATKEIEDAAGTLEDAN